MRASVDVVVPFAGSELALAGLVRQWTENPLTGAARTIIVDNRAPTIGNGFDHALVIPAPDVGSSYHARNRGAERGAGEWILFLDADVIAPADLIDRYFKTPPADGTAVLAGGVLDEPLEPEAASAAASFAERSARMSQANTLQGDFGYAQTANCAIRRSSFEEVGGFADAIRSGGDADICLRLREAGWEIEARPDAAVVHRARRTVGGLLVQRIRQGAGTAWVERRHPGAFPGRSPRRLAGLAVWSARSLIRGLKDLMTGDREGGLHSFIEPLDVWAQELGRRLPNEVSARQSRMPH